MNKSARRALAAAACTVGLVALGAQPAMAGEITGEGTLKEVKGKSECAYSGLNDGWVDPQYLEEGEIPTRTQNWGHTKAFIPVKGVPGFACNPAGKRIPPL